MFTDLLRITGILRSGAVRLSNIARGVFAKGVAAWGVV